MPSTSYRPGPSSPQAPKPSWPEKFKRLRSNPWIPRGLACIGVALWLLITLGGPVAMTCDETVSAPWVLVSPALFVSAVLFIPPILVTWWWANAPDGWGTLQRIMLWQAAAGAAFLAIDWDVVIPNAPEDTNKRVKDAFGLIAVLWVAGGAMGVWLEPIKSWNKKGSKH